MEVRLPSTNHSAESPWRANLLCFIASRGKIFVTTIAFPVLILGAPFFSEISLIICLPIMSVMKDITNLTSNASEDSHESSPERDIFISQVPRRKRTSKQAALDRFFEMRDMTNEDEPNGKSESETDEAAQSAFMTPEVEPRKKEKPQKRKRLRLGGNSRTGGPTSPALSVTLNGLSKSQLVDLMTTLVTERHPDLEQVNIAFNVSKIP